MTLKHGKLIATLGAVGALGIATGTAGARQGADDPAGHNAGDDHGGLVVKHDARDDRRAHESRARHRHHHRVRQVTRARHHSDDGPNHDARDDHGRR